MYFKIVYIEFIHRNSDIGIEYCLDKYSILALKAGRTSLSFRLNTTRDFET